MIRQPVRHISFDLWMTLIRSGKEFKRIRNLAFIEFFSIDGNPDDILYTFQQYDRIFNAINEQTGRNLSYAEMLYLVLNALGKDIHAVSLQQTEDFYRLSEELFFKHPPELLEPDTAGIFAQLAATGYTLSIMSNTAFIRGATLRPLLTQYGIADFLSFQLYSDELECSKPSPKIFDVLHQQARRLSSVSSDEILHIGDNKIADFAGAQAAGMQALLFEPDAHQPLREILNLLCTAPLPDTI